MGLAEQMQEEAKLELKHHQEQVDALASPYNAAIQKAVLSALHEVHTMRDNLTAAQERGRHLIDESRGLRRMLVRIADKLSYMATDGTDATELFSLACLAREAAKVPPCT